MDRDNNVVIAKRGRCRNGWRWPNHMKMGDICNSVMLKKCNNNKMKP